MAQNKLKQKVESLTKVVQALIKELQHNVSMAQGTLTAFQLHVGKEEWEKIVEELKDVEKRKHAAAAGINEKKLDLDVE
jgi:ACT domain-containing protein|tara:strand:+ start:224 stop:460 length:237 start_codon:yes stop_codon:yes gene_type:complete